MASCGQAGATLLCSRPCTAHGVPCAPLPGQERGERVRRASAWHLVAVQQCAPTSSTLPKQNLLQEDALAGTAGLWIRTQVRGLIRRPLAGSTVWTQGSVWPPVDGAGSRQMWPCIDRYGRSWSVSASPAHERKQQRCRLRMGLLQAVIAPCRRAGLGRSRQRRRWRAEEAGQLSFAWIVLHLHWALARLATSGFSSILQRQITAPSTAQARGVASAAESPCPRAVGGRPSVTEVLRPSCRGGHMGDQQAVHLRHGLQRQAVLIGQVEQADEAEMH